MWRNDIKCKYMFMFSLKNLARKGLISENPLTVETSATQFDKMGLNS